MFNNKFNPILKHPGYNAPVVAAVSAIAPVISAVSAVASIVGMFGSKGGENKAIGQSIAEQKKAEQARAKADELRAQRERTSQIREGRIRRAQVQAQGTNAGLGAGTSGIAGGSASVVSQVGSNIGAMGQQQQLAGIASTAMQRSADFQAKAMQWQEVGSFSKSIFDAAGGFTTIFGGNRAKSALPGSSSSPIR